MKFQFGFVSPETFFFAQRFPGLFSSYRSMSQSLDFFQEPKQIFFSSLYPHFSTEMSCTLMRLHNLAKPEWINIKCHDHFSAHFVCLYKEQLRTDSRNTNQKTNKFCSPFCVSHREKCFHFMWQDNSSWLPNICHKHFVFNQTGELNFFLNNFRLSPIVSKKITFKLGMFLRYSTQFFVSPGFHVCLSKHRTISSIFNVFKCKDNTGISLVRICDCTVDCHDNSDETYCTCDKVKNSTFCARNITRSSDELCLESPHKDWKCFKLPAEETGIDLSPSISDAATLPCHNLSADHILFNDLINDCGQNAEDEPLLRLLLESKPSAHLSCKTPSQIPCLTGHPKCYDIFDTCVYRKSSSNKLIPCRNGAHLENCRDFQCNMMFKCPKYYCIPWEYVCDGNWDCPEATEEVLFCEAHNCSDMYKCTGRDTICVHLGKVCDEYENCPNGDDERNCKLKEFTCPGDCHCLLESFVCEETTLYDIKTLHYFVFVTIVNSAIDIQFLHTLNSAKYFVLIRMPVVISCKMLAHKQIIYLLLNFNNMNRIQQLCLTENTNTQNIQFSANNITEVQTKAFVNLTNLCYLNLSENLLTTFLKGTIVGVNCLTVLSLYGNHLKDIKGDAFENLCFQLLETKDFRLCCFVSGPTKCNLKRPWYISCSDLLPNNSLKIVFIVISTLIILFNILSMILSSASHRETSKSQIVVTIFINFVEAFLGIYLCIIWIADIIFQDDFVIKERHWRSGVACHVASSLVLLFNFGDPPMIFLMSLSRLMVVKYPMESKFKRTKFTSICASLIMITTSALSVLVSSLVGLLVSELSTTFCLIFVDPADSSPLSKISTLLLVSLQLVASSLVSPKHLLKGTKHLTIIVTIRASITAIAAPKDRFDTRDCCCRLLQNNALLWS